VNLIEQQAAPLRLTVVVNWLAGFSK